MDKNIYQLLSDLTAQAPGVRREYNDLFDPPVPTIPIPYFGDLLNARVITVGLNPSDGELSNGNWPESIGIQSLFERLTHYFCDPRYPPPQSSKNWFKWWTQGLNEIDVSYSKGTAAHVDLCSWSTRPLSSYKKLSKLEIFKKRKEFEKLVKQSLPLFWRCLQMATSAKLVLMAGSVTNGDYLNEFILKNGNTKDFSLIDKVERNGDAFVGYHRVRLPGKEIPVFFCSVSPSSFTKRMLPIRLQENREQLMMLLR